MQDDTVALKACPIVSPAAAAKTGGCCLAAPAPPMLACAVWRCGRRCACPTADSYRRSFPPPSCWPEPLWTNSASRWARGCCCGQPKGFKATLTQSGASSGDAGIEPRANNEAVVTRHCPGKVLRLDQGKDSIARRKDDGTWQVGPLWLSLGSGYRGVHSTPTSN